jgi:transcriptional regulator with XRE-family HTH domain
LNISQAAYTKLERGETKLTVERLFQIADMLKTDVAELLGLDNKYNQDIHNNTNPTIIAHQEIENQYIEDKGIVNELLKKYEEALSSKNKLIEMLEN